MNTGKEEKMVKKGTKVTLLPRMDFKDQPERFVEKYAGDDKFGHWQEFSIVDRTFNMERSLRGYLILRFYTEQELNVGDVVEIGELIGVYAHKRNITVVVSVAGDEDFELMRELGI